MDYETLVHILLIIFIILILTDSYEAIILWLEDVGYSCWNFLRNWKEKIKKYSKRLFKRLFKR